MAPGPLGDRVARHGESAGHRRRIRLDDLPAIARISTRRSIRTFKKKYIDTGKVRFMLREFPLDPVAAGAFMLARCAARGQILSDGRRLVRAAEKLGLRQGPAEGAA